MAATITSSALESKLMDLIFLGNTPGVLPFSTIYFALLDVNGVEITNGTTYPRVPFVCNESTWFDSNGGTDPVSTGTRGYTSNNGPIRWNKPIANYTARIVAAYDAPSDGNLLFAMAASYTGDATTDVYGPQIYAEGLKVYFGPYNGADAPYPFPMSRYINNKMIDYLFRGNASGWAGNSGSLYLAMMTHSYDSETVPVEVSTTLTGYARQPIECNLTNGWTRIDTKTLRNKNLIEFPPVTATYGMVTGYALYDAPTGGNMVWSSPWNNPQRVEYGDERPRVAANVLEIKLDIEDVTV